MTLRGLKIAGLDEDWWGFVDIDLTVERRLCQGFEGIYLQYDIIIHLIFHSLIMH